MSKYNYLFSTTRQWNPGDEFILFGLINLLKEAGHNFNPIIYNRNPDVRENYTALNMLRRFEPTFKGKGLLNSFFRIGFKDNSYKNYSSSKIIDRVYFAGSPEWQTYRLQELYKLIEKEHIPVEFHGIGAWSDFSRNDMRPIVDRVLKNAKAITVRDEYSYQVMAGHYNVKYLSCPALFSARSKKQVTKVEKIGLIFSTCKTLHGNRVSEGAYVQMLNFYREFLCANSSKEVKFICHYIDEIEDCIEQFPGVELEYSYDARDYEVIYGQFDFVIGARVHGIGMAASQHIPGILFSHDARGSTGKGFGIEVVQVGSISAEQVTQKLDDPMYVKQIIENIKSLKLNAKAEYIDLFRC